VSVLDRLGAAFKAASSILWPRGLSTWTFQPRTHRDYGLDLDQGRGSNIVQACVLWMCRTFPEAPPRVRRVKANGELEDWPDHPLSLLLSRPNPYYSGSLLWWATLADWMFGNAYWFKVRSGARIPVQYLWLPASGMEPRWDQDGREFITHYEYNPNGTIQRLAVEDVVHWRYGLDPRNPRKGLSPLGSLFRELFTDEEASNFSASLLSNLGVPGVVISPGGDNSLTQPEADAVKASWRMKFNGDRRGEPLVLSEKADVRAFGFSPQQMVLRDVRRIPEERVTAIFGIPAIVVGLGAGLDRSTFSNFEQAREAATETLLVPTWRLFSEEMQSQVAPDFAGRFTVDFDLSKVRVLQDDQDALHVRAREDVKAGLVTLNEGRQMIGKDAIPDGDVLYVPTTVGPTAPADLLNAPVASPGASGGNPALLQAAGLDGAARKQLAERAGPFDYTPDPLPAAVYDAAERRKLARAWDTAFEGTEFVGMLDAEAVNGNGTH
jgi:HK97 family phage portal protein